MKKLITEGREKNSRKARSTVSQSESVVLKSQ